MNVVCCISNYKKTHNVNRGSVHMTNIILHKPVNGLWHRIPTLGLFTTYCKVFSHHIEWSHEQSKNVFLQLCYIPTSVQYSDKLRVTFFKCRMFFHSTYYACVVQTALNIHILLLGVFVECSPCFVPACACISNKTDQSQLTAGCIGRQAFCLI